jgi:hypothetical protein
MKIPREENEKANRLAQIASATNGDMEESEEPDQILSQPSITEIVSILVSATEALPEWKMEIVEYLEKGILSPNKKLAIQLRTKATITAFHCLDGLSLNNRGVA